MTRIGWIVLGGIVLVVALFASVVRIGGPRTAPVPAAPAPVRPDVDAAGVPVLLVPVAGVRRDRIVDTWGQARSEGRVHHGTDIMAPGGTPVLAAADGRVEKLFQSRLGGTTLYQRSTDRRWTLYYAHLAGYLPGVHEGQMVRAGEPIAYIGDTGDAGPGNYHLHFSTARLRPDQRWWEGEDVNAYPMLRGRRQFSAIVLSSTAMDRLIRLHIERLPEGDYLATSEDVQGLVVEAPTMQELLALVPQVVEMLEEIRREHGWAATPGEPLPQSFELPFFLAA